MIADSRHAAWLQREFGGCGCHRAASHHLRHNPMQHVGHATGCHIGLSVGGSVAIAGTRHVVCRQQHKRMARMVTMPHSDTGSHHRSDAQEHDTHDYVAQSLHCHVVWFVTAKIAQFARLEQMSYITCRATRPKLERHPRRGVRGKPQPERRQKRRRRGAMRAIPSLY